MSNQLVQLIKQMSVEATENNKPADIVFGTVEEIEPLVIAIDQKIKLKQRMLILTNAVRDYNTEITFNNPNIKQAVKSWNMPETIEDTPYKIAFAEKKKHEITVYNALKVGEKVILLRKQGGQKFIVLDRLVEI